MVQQCATIEKNRQDGERKRPIWYSGQEGDRLQKTGLFSLTPRGQSRDMKNNRLGEMTRTRHKRPMSFIKPFVSTNPGAP
jgi:hypothetical protein